MNIESNKQEYINNLDDIVSEIQMGHLSVFIGAGVSTSSGYVDWNGLMQPIIEQLGVNPDIDLPLAAQFYVNEYPRHNISKLIYNEFNKPAKENNVLKLLGSMPITSYWTTNYDSMIEDTLESEPISKTIELRLNKNDFKFHKLNCEATVNKMHGDKNSPDEAVITKDDYETYDEKREVFSKALSVELITNTFLFIGFSFYDPNLERILNIVKHTFESKREKKHYCFMRKVSQKDYNNDVSYMHDLNYQTLRVSEMRRYGIETILLDDFSQIEVCLHYIKSMLNHKRIFISGSLQPNPLKPKEITKDSDEAIFIQYLAENLTNKGYKIVSGFGQNIGNYLLIGACTNKKPSEIRNLHNLIEIYPLVTKIDDVSLLREELISNCGSLITIFGKTNNNSDYDIDIKTDGVNIEYEYAKKHNLTVLPIGATGYTSQILWKKENIIGPSEDWNNLNSKSYAKDKDIILESIIHLIEYNYKEKQSQLKKELKRELIGKKTTPQKIFLSFHYNSSHQHANKIRQLINNTKLYITNEEEKISDDINGSLIKQWIKEKICDTVATILIYDEVVFQSDYVKYEIEQSINRQNSIIVLSLTDNLKNAQKAIKKSGLFNCEKISYHQFSKINTSDDILKILQENI